MEPLLCVDRMHRMQLEAVDATFQPYIRKIKWLSEMFSAQKNSALARKKTNRSKATLRKPKRCRIFQLRCKRDSVRFSFCDSGRFVSDKQIWRTRTGNGNRQDRRQWKLCSGKSQVCYSYRKQFEQADDRLQSYWPYAYSTTIRKLSSGMTREEIIQDAENAVAEKRKCWRFIAARLDFMTYKMPEDIIVLPYRESLSTTAATAARSEQ